MNNHTKIFNPEVPLKTNTEFITYWNVWYQHWEAAFYSNSLKKQKQILGWVLPPFFGNTQKTKSSFIYSPEPYSGKLNDVQPNKIYLKIHPKFENENINNHLIFNSEPFESIAKLYNNSETITFNIIPWRSFAYHTDIASYLYEPQFLKQSPFLVENKVLIPMINYVSKFTNNSRIYTESNYISSLLLVNNFQYIQTTEDLNTEFIIEDNIKYKCFDIYYNGINIRVLHKCY